MDDIAGRLLLKKGHEWEDQEALKAKCDFLDDALHWNWVSAAS